MRIGIVGVSGYGGSELLRLCVGHPAFEVVYASGESTVGPDACPALPRACRPPTGKIVIQPFVPEKVDGLDLLFASLPTGKSKEPLARMPGGDQDRRCRRRSSLRRGLDLRPDRIARPARADREARRGLRIPAAIRRRRCSRSRPWSRKASSNPTASPSTPRAASPAPGAAARATSATPKRTRTCSRTALQAHTHVPEIKRRSRDLAGRNAIVAFTPHLVPMTRGILATCYARPRGKVDTARLYAAAEAAYRNEPFVKIVAAEKGQGPHQVGDRLEPRLSFLLR